MNLLEKKRPIRLLCSYALAIVSALVLRAIVKRMNLPETHPGFVIPFLLIPGSCIISFFWSFVSMITANYPKYRQVLHAILMIMWMVIFVVATVNSICSVLG